jgi:hypothetical protein
MDGINARHIYSTSFFIIDILLRLITILRFRK